MPSNEYTAEARLIEPVINQEGKPETWAEFCARLEKDKADFKAAVIASRKLVQSR